MKDFSRHPTIVLALRLLTDSQLGRLKYHMTARPRTRAMVGADANKWWDQESGGGCLCSLATSTGPITKSLDGDSDQYHYPSAEAARLHNQLDHTGTLFRVTSMLRQSEFWAAVETEVERRRTNALVGEQC